MYAVLEAVLENWKPHHTHLIEEQPWPAPSSLECNPRVKVLELYRDVPSHIQDYAVHVLDWYLNVLIELGANFFRPLFEHCFLPWIEIFYVFSSTLDKYKFVENVLLKVISLVNVSCSCSTSCYGLIVAFI